MDTAVTSIDSIVPFLAHENVLPGNKSKLLSGKNHV